MMTYRSSVGDALASLGQTLPEILRQKRLDADRARREQAGVETQALQNRAAEQALEEAQKKSRLSDEGLSELRQFVTDRNVGRKLGEIDLSHLDEFQPSPVSDVGPVDVTPEGQASALRQDVMRTTGQNGVDELDRLGGGLGASSPVDIPASRAVDLASNKTNADDYLDAMGALGQHRGNNSQVDLYLDDLRSLAAQDSTNEEKRALQENALAASAANAEASRAQREEDRALRQQMQDEQMNLRRDLAGDAQRNKDFTQEQKLAGQFDALSSSYRTVRDAYSRIQESGKNPTPAGDMALLYQYMRILDPGSVVRESEFEMAAKTGALPEQISAAAQRVVNGKRLSDSQRKDFLARAQLLYSAQQKTQPGLEAQYREIARGYGLDPTKVVKDFGLPDDDASDGTASTPNVGISQPKTQQEYDALPAGSEYIDTDGLKKRKR